MTLLTHLSILPPATLRAQLREPDPVQLHDWHVTAAHYKAAIRLTLIALDRRCEMEPAR